MLSRWRNVFGIGLAAVSSLLVVFSLIALVAYLVERDSYVFGFEAGGWRYRSSANYMFASLLDLVTASLALGLGLVAVAEKINMMAPLFALVFAILIYVFL